MNQMTSSNGGGSGRPFVKKYQQNKLDYELIDSYIDHAQFANHDNLNDPSKSTGAGSDGGISSWFGGLQTRTPSSSTMNFWTGQNVVFDVYEIASSTLGGITQAKTFKVLKFLFFLLIKFKLFALIKLWFIVKLLVLAKIAKIILLPFLTTLIISIFNTNTNTPVLVPNPEYTTTTTTTTSSPIQPENPGEIIVTTSNVTTIITSSSSSRNDNTTVPIAGVQNRFVNFNTLSTDFVPKLARFVSIVQSAQCVQRMACNEAGSKSPDLEFAWING